MAKTQDIKSNIQDAIIAGHRYGKKLTNNDYGTVAFLINKSDILKDKKANANSFIEPELRYNCIYFLIGHEYDTDGNSIEKMYVGQAGIRDNNQSVLDRLNEHAWLGNDPAKYIDKWTDIVVVTNEKGAWGATELDAIEHIFWSLIPVGNRYNTVKPTSTGADLEQFTTAVNQIKEYLDYLEFSMFKEKTEEVITQDVMSVAESKSDTPIDLDHGTTSIPNITTPKKVIDAMLDLLPDDVWNDTTVFLDPACKDGGYLKAIHDRLVARPELIQKYGNERKLSNHILSEQLFGIALNQNSRAVTIDKLDGFGYNIRVIPNYISYLRDKNNSDNTLKILIEREFGEKMNIDVVIGNPPYNDDNTKVATAIYSRFVENGMKLASKYTAFIIPSRWYASGRGLESFRAMMLSKKRLKKLVDYADAKMIFPNTQISGGVCYFLADKEQNEKCEVTTVNSDGEKNTSYRILRKYEIFVRDAIAIDIIDRIIDAKFSSLSAGVQSVDYFNVKDNIAVHGYKTGETNIEILDSTGILYANREDLSDPYNLIDCYNVMVTHAVGSEGYVIPNTLKILDKGKACSVTYLCIGGTQELYKAENLLKYIKTKFVRFLMKQAISGINISSKSFKFVPIQDFSENSDINWNTNLADIDKQLYKKYNLLESESEYIENMIKSMDSYKAI